MVCPTPRRSQPFSRKCPRKVVCPLRTAALSLRVPKWLKFIVAVLLLPACAGMVSALWRVLRASGNATDVWVPLVAGAACWLVIFAMLPKPMWIYVVGHELTHVVWSWLFGGKVKKFRASSSGGEVVVTKSR